MITMDSFMWFMTGVFFGSLGFAVALGIIIGGEDEDG